MERDRCERGRLAVRDRDGIAHQVEKDPERFVRIGENRGATTLADIKGKILRRGGSQ
jgi:hypothetical protein